MFDLGKGSFGFAPPNSQIQSSTDCQMNRIYQGEVTNVEMSAHWPSAIRRLRTPANPFWTCLVK